MQNLLELAGSKDEKQTRFAPLFVNRLFTGIWTQRNPLRDPSSVGYERWYGGRPDALLNGRNVELTNNLTLARAPGSSPWSSASFSGAINSFYSFKQFSITDESITLIADTSTIVYSVTRTAKTNIFTKTSGAGNTSFLGVGNVLYFGDGIDQKAYQNGSVRNWGISIGSFSSTATSSTATGTDTGTGGNESWTSPSNIDSIPANYASSTIGPVSPSPDTSTYLSALNWGFSISGTIVSASITFTAHVDFLGGPFLAVWVWIVSNGSILATGTAINVSAASDTVYTLPLDPTGLTAALANSATFGVYIRAQNVPYHIGFATNYSTGTINLTAASLSIQHSGGPGVSLVGGGVSPAPSTGYQYVVMYGSNLGTFGGGTNQVFSTASPPSDLVKPDASHSVQIALIASSDPQVNQIWLLRTKDGGVTFYNLPTSPYANATVNVVDSAADTALNTNQIADVTDLNTPPPTGLTALAYHMGRPWGAVQNVVYYAVGPDLGNVLGNPNEGFPSANFFTFPSKVTRLVPTAIGLLVFTISDIFIIYGNGSAAAASTGVSGITVFYATPFIQRVGLLSPFALDVNGTTIYMMSADGQGLSLDPSSGVSEIGFPVAAPPSGYYIQDVPTLADFTAANTYVTWHVDGSADKAVYVSDGTLGWFRCNTSQAPDGGFVWSPKRFITGGCQAVQSIETNPGNYQLLIGPGTGGGKILVRNDSITGVIAAVSLTSNVATYTVAYSGVPGNANTFSVGQYVNVAGTTQSSGIFNVTNAPITAIGAGTFSVALVHANVGSVADAGSAVLANSDNGTPYAANYTMGSIVLAQPGQIAEVGFFTCDFRRIGTSPQLLVLWNEIKADGLNDDSDFENLSSYVVQDPPSLYGTTLNPATLFANRYYALQTVSALSGQNPVGSFCRHLQMKIDYGSSDVVPNELLDFTIFGCHYGEI